ncbi:MAG: hypothetical protein R3231_00315 [bacterium]|nr:hypothetical protein [bacterium]
MITEIGERVEVTAFFGEKGTFRPLSFVWQKQEISVRQVVYHWLERDGMATAYSFSVTDGASTYQLRYDPGRLAWQLVAVETEG